MEKLTRKRIWKWKYLIGKRFHSIHVLPGFFTVKKIWEYKIIDDHIKNFDGTNVFTRHSVLVKMDNGERYIIPKLLLDIEKSFDKVYPKKS